MIECICRRITTADIDSYAEKHNCTYLDAFSRLLEEREEGCGKCEEIIILQNKLEDK